ncbi:helix-turn-helix domain-containing protein [Sporofaciens musculi]|jgi:AraC-like DNA-binding protein|uniref:helix-turn-helix domain-containing protein n=1 Tax=Sporofaciens musculi TaxID=2681861 RepID=UPI00216EBE43|nr:AraC family transcriptional regulator [Sporofaciens musculi]MCI9421628.1 AraC family transcriptional regulator [Dorea sp.]
MSKKRKPKIEFRYYRMPEGSPLLALLGQRWVQTYGRDIDYLHFHNYLEIGYCYEGEGTLTLGERDYRYTGGEISIIPKNYPHTTNSDPGTVSKWEYVFVDVEGLLEELYQKGGNVKRMKYLLHRINSQAIFRGIEEAPGIAKMVRGILDIMRDTKEFYLEEAKGLMVALLVCIARENPDDKGPVEISGKITIPVSRALDYITLHYMEPLKVEELAKWCHISETHFRRVFSTYMHMGPLEYINLVRVQTACNYLKNTDESMADIAGKCGFTTLSTFNRNFKQVTGVSPSEWRKRPENYEQQLLKYWIHSEEGW